MISKQRLSKLSTVAQNRQAGLALVLEDIHDPHNAAAILRTCDGLGIQDVYVIFEQEKFYNLKKLGKVSSSSANKWLSLHLYRSAEECFRDLKKAKYKICSTILNKKAENSTKTDLTAKKIALVVGNEHRGISPTAIKSSDHLLYFPMQGFVQSFNVSVTAALFLYEIIRQRMTSPPAGMLKHTSGRRSGAMMHHSASYRLSKKDSQKLLADFKKR